MLKNSFFPILLAMSITLCAQENPKIDKSNLLSQAENIKAAKRNLKKGEKYYKSGYYDAALQHYVKLHRIDANDPALNYKMGISTLYGVNPKNALPFFEALEPDVAKDYYCQKGIALIYNNKYSEAKEAFHKYLEQLSPKELKKQTEKVKRFIEICDFSSDAMNNSMPVFIDNLGPQINSYYDDYSAVELLVPNKSIYYTTRRPLDDDLDFADHSVYNERILFSSDFQDGKVTGEAKEARLVSSKHLSVAGTDSERNLLMYYKGKKRFGDLRSVRFKINGKSTMDKRLSKKISQKTTKESSITFDAQGNAYFVSNRGRGQGGMDIWYAAKRGKRSFKKPVNLKTLNTPLTEDGVYVSSDGRTLYFSSNGRRGMGGFDVYKSQKNDDGIWGEPVNMGAPINSHDDDIYFRITSDSTIALLSSKRSGGFGGLDIYSVRKDLRIPFELTGTVTDADNGASLPAVVSLFSEETNMPLKTATIDSIDNMYLIAVEDTARYYLQADVPGYRSDTAHFTNPTTRHAKIERNFALHRLLHPFTLNGYLTDVKTGKPVKGELIFKTPANNATIQRVVANEAGYYTVTFEDKMNVAVDVKAENYFDHNETLPLHDVKEATGSKNFTLQRSKNSYIVSGIVTDAKTGDPLIAKIDVTQADNKQVATNETTDAEGKYSIQLSDVGPFLIEVNSDGYFFVNHALQFEGDSTLVIRNFALTKLETGATAVIDNILFAFGKATLLPSSFASLDKVVDLMHEYPKIRMEISGHTDNVGSEATNKKLSRSRALSVKNYLVSQGITEDRLEFEGYGFDHPIAPNTTEEGRAQNRRVEMKILEN